MLLENNQIDEVADTLRPDHFYSDINGSIYAAVLKLYESNKKVDAVTLAEQLDKDGKLEEIGGVPYLLELLEAVPHAAHTRHYADTIVEDWRRRETINIGQELAAHGHDKGREIRDTIANADKKLCDIAMSRESRETTIEDCLLAAMDDVNERIQKGGMTGVSMGYSNLDDITGGMAKTDMVVVAARPSMGKTSFMMCMARAAAQNGIFTGVFSLEQSKVKIAERFVVADTGLDSHNVRLGRLEPADRHAFLDSASKLAKLPIVVQDTPSMSVSEIGAAARRLKRRSNLGIIFVDYLQRIRSTSSRLQRDQQVAEISRALKDLAQYLEIPVVCLAQLNRGVENREDKRPRLADLRESGAIEQDADQILFIHRPDQYNPDEKPGMAEIIVGKNRDGRTGIAELSYRKHCYRFELPAEEWQQPPGGMF